MGSKWRFFSDAVLLGMVIGLTVACEWVDEVRSSNSKSEDSLATCQNDICEIQVPLSYSANKGTIGLRYYYSKGSEETAPTVIYFPGGPGGSSIEGALFYRELIPKKYALLLLDPRGSVSQTQAGENTAEYYSTETLANDAISVMRHLNLSNYIVYASSYGTMWATRTLHKIRNNQATIGLPKFVVLQGILGRAFTSEVEAKQNFLQLWDFVAQNLDSNTLIKFMRSLSSDEAVWGQVLSSMLAGNSLIAFTVLQNAMKGDPESIAEIKAALAEGHEDKLAKLDVFKFITCREILNDSPVFEFKVNLGTLKMTSILYPDYCKDFEFTPYDSRQFAYNVKTYFFNGELDPATPLWLAELQSGSKVENLFIVPQAGHGPLHNELADCSSSLWTAMEVSENETRKAFNACPWVQRFKADGASLIASDKPKGLEKISTSELKHFWKIFKAK